MDETARLGVPRVDVLLTHKGAHVKRAFVKRAYHCLLNLLPERWRAIGAQVLRFGLVGVLNTGVTYALYFGLLMLSLRAGLAWFMAYVAGMAVSLALNTRWTFGQRERLSAWQVGRFVAVNVAALLVSTALVALMADGLRWNKQLSGVLATPFSMAINYLGNRWFVYKSR